MEQLKQKGLTLTSQDIECLFTKLKKHDLNKIDHLELHQYIADASKQDAINSPNLSFQQQPTSK